MRTKIPAITPKVNNEEALNKVDALQSELDNTLEAMWQHSDFKGLEWIILNYPKKSQELIRKYGLLID